MCDDLVLRFLNLNKFAKLSWLASLTFTDDLRVWLEQAHALSRQLCQAFEHSCSCLSYDLAHTRPHFGQRSSQWAEESAFPFWSNLRLHPSRVACHSGSAGSSATTRDNVSSAAPRPQHLCNGQTVRSQAHAYLRYAFDFALRVSACPSASQFSSSSA